MTEDSGSDGSSAGASLQREYERRVAARNQRIRSRHPRLGGLLLALTDEPASTRAFAVGADGERRLARRLEELAGPDVLFLHNRRLGRGRRAGDIDHLAIAPSGVYVIDAKHYADKKVRVRRTGGLLTQVREQLMVAGRDRTRLVAGCEKQREAVVAALDGVQPVEVSGVLCFIDADLPLFGTPRIRDVVIQGPRATGKQLRQPGTLDATRREQLREILELALPPA